MFFEIPFANPLKYFRKTKNFLASDGLFSLLFSDLFESYSCFQIRTLNMQLSPCLYVFNIVIVLYFKFYNLSCTSCLANELGAW